MRYPLSASKSNLIAKDASYARCDMLDRLYEIVEGQKTISTRKLEKILDDMQEDFKLDAIF